MSDVHVFPGVIESQRKQEFLAHVSRCYDSHVAKNGEPDSLVFVLGGVGQPVEPFWMINGDSRASTNHVLAMASVILARQ